MSKIKHRRLIIKSSTKKILTVILAAAMIFTTVVIGFADDFDSSWTAVTNAEELKAIENDMAGKYYLANDITLTDSWEPIGWIGSKDVAFTGTFDGNGKTISALKMDCADELLQSSNVGLFAVNDGTIKNLTVASPVIYGSTQVGAIAGTNNGTISSCSVKGGKVPAVLSRAHNTLIGFMTVIRSAVLPALTTVQSKRALTAHM